MTTVETTYQLGEIRLDSTQKGADGFVRSWVMLLPQGDFEYRGAPLTLSEKVLKEYKANFDRKVRGVDIALDVDHKASSGDSRSFGWIEQIEYFKPGQAPVKFDTTNGPAALWGLVRWTELGLHDVEAQIYRYISAEMKPEWENPTDGKTYRNVIIGAALTNRPFMNQMPAIALKERQTEESTQLGLGNSHLNKLLGAPKTVEEDDEEEYDLDDGDLEDDEEPSDLYAEDDEEGEEDQEDAEDQEDEESEAEDDENVEPGETERVAAPRNSRRRSRRQNRQKETAAMSEERDSSVVLAETTRKLAEAEQRATAAEDRERKMAVQLHEQAVERRITAWTAPANGQAGPMAATKAFTDAYRAFMLSQGIALSEDTVKGFDELLELAMQGSVELGQRSLSEADMESRSTRTAGKAGTGDDLMKEADRIALSETGEHYAMIARKAAKGDAEYIALRQDILVEAMKKTNTDARTLGFAMTEG